MVKIKISPILFIYFCKKTIPKWLVWEWDFQPLPSIFVGSPRCRRARARLHRAAEAHDVETMIRRGGKVFLCFFWGQTFNLDFFTKLNTFVK